MLTVYHGEDEFSQNERLAAFKAGLGDPSMIDLNTTRLDGRTVNLGELRHACDSVPFLADRRLVVVEGLLSRLAGRNAGKKDQAEDSSGASTTAPEMSGSQKEFLDSLLAYLPALPEWTELVLVERRKMPLRNPVLTLAEKLRPGSVILFEVPSAAELPRWIESRARMLGGAITPQASVLLAEFVGDDLRLQERELEKLLTYVAGQRRPVGEADVRLLTPYAGEASVFDMVDAIGRRDGKMAAHLLHKLLDGGEHPLMLLTMIVRQFRLLIQVKELSGQGRTPAEIARTLGLHPYPTGKLADQARRFSPGMLDAIYHRLLEVDVSIKTGEMDGVLALDMLIASLS